jgi:hypothetical protein
MNDVATELAPALGHNSPPDDITILRERLEDEAASLLRRRDELLGSVDRAPLEIGDDDTAGRVADLIKLVMACHKNAEAARVARKEPFLASGRAVDGFYKQITDPLERAKKTVESRLTAYQRRKADEERRRREEEARAQAAEAERQRRDAEAAAAALKSEEDLDAAIIAEEHAAQAAADAVQAQRAAEAKPADLSRSRGTFGSVASLRTFWDFTDLDRAALDLETLRPHLPQDAIEKAVRSFIKAGGRELRGVKIFENTASVVR